jgi:hypothetical protein
MASISVTPSRSTIKSPELLLASKHTYLGPSRKRHSPLSHACPVRPCADDAQA